MKIERADRVSGPLVVGRFYLVPCVHAQWGAVVRDWPVIGPRHNDREFFNFTTWHYHVDARFLRPSDGRVYDTLSYPLHGRHHPTRSKYLELPRPVWRRRKCLQAGTDFSPGGRLIEAMREHYAGQQCAKGKGGWICPHRKAPLGSIAPDANGLITCPLHGLRINAATGVVLLAGSAA